MKPRRPSRPFVRRSHLPLSPAFKNIQDWPPANRGFYAAFRDWLYHSGYGPSALSLYGVAARLAFSLVEKPYWQMEPEADLNRVRDYIRAQYPSLGTQQSYLKGIAKLEQYLRLRCQKPKPEKPVNWATYVGPLPEAVAVLIQRYVEHRQHYWPVDRRRELAHDLLSPLTLGLRWLAAHRSLQSIADLTPQAWFAYVDARLVDGLSPVALNDELATLLGWLHWLHDEGQPVCARMFKVERLDEGPHLPKDAPLEQLRKVLAVIQTAANATHAGIRRMGVMDQAWFLLMLYSGLRTGEVRRLQVSDIDWERRLIRIEQSKGLKDRLVPMSAATIEALQHYLDVRGPRIAGVGLHLSPCPTERELLWGTADEVLPHPQWRQAHATSTAA